MAMAVLCFAVAMTASAETVTGECGLEGNNLIWTFDTETGVLNIKGEGKMKSNANSIWSSYKNQISKVEIEDGVEDIGTSAFSGCTKIESVLLPNSLTNIRTGAFRNCDSLKAINIPDSVVCIDSLAFIYCDELENIHIGKSLSKLYDRAFYQCYKLKNFSVDENNEHFSSMGGVLVNKSLDTIFYFPQGRSGSYTIPDCIQKIAYSAFRSCRYIESLNIPDSVKYIGELAFGECYKLTGIYVSEDNEYYTDIDGILFNKKLTSIICYPAGKTEETYKFPNTITEIGVSAFYTCEYIKYMVLPISVETISRASFAYCYNLETILLHNSIKEIQDLTFSNCSSLSDIYYLGTEESWEDIKIGSLTGTMNKAKKHFINSPSIETITGTCKDYGYTKYTYVCTSCDSACSYEYITDYILSDHLFTCYTSDNNATCLADGTKTAYCDYGCGATDTLTDEGSALGHNMSNFVVTKEATCTVKGEERADCSRCDYYETKELVANNHKDENLDGYCEYCEEYIADKNCICICHAKTIGAFIYELFKLIDSIFNTNLVSKVFDISDVCVCGIKH